ncbi:MAG: hypothetical protein MUP16_06480 [Sedimentisphaerales bacterium]|nr:hypothetical protein [Sedimentisphaerales bacterium]
MDGYRNSQVRLKVLDTKPCLSTDRDGVCAERIEDRRQRTEKNRLLRTDTLI